MQNKVVIITGGGSGIGRACALAFGEAGYMVVISGRRMEKLEELSTLMQAQGHDVLAVSGDVSQEEDCRRLVEACLQKYGRIDVLINNAGLSMRALFEETNLDVLRKLMDTNFWGTVYCTKYALPHLLHSGGSVVGISSIAGKKGLPGRSGYSASKFAMEGFLETLRTENLKKGLHVLVACPGFTASEIRSTALAADGSRQGESPREENKMMPAEVVARHILKAVRLRRRDLVLTFNGKVLLFLNKFFPGYSDQLVYRHMAKEPGSPFR
ncbi:MAG: SDR family oxidoreductase [Bacteroidia bacterium]|nr:SDR family oxidoreductase [Bacteroidia bacterium]